METQNIRKISDLPEVAGNTLTESEKILIEKSGAPKNVTLQTINRAIIGSAKIDAVVNDEASTLKLQLKNKDNTVVSEKTISYPMKSVQDDVTAIKEKIPSTASADNKLADKNFVNSSIGTNTAKYISNNGEPFTSVEQLQAYSGTVTQNDYAFVTGTDSGNTYYDRYKADVSGDTVTWGKEYRLNNSSFTADQWGAINSGVTSGKLEEIDEAIASIGSTVPEPTAKDKLLISNEELEWVEVDKDQVGEVTTRCTKAEWEAKTEAERIALSGSAVDILDDYSEADNNVYSTEETVVGKWIDGKKIYRKVCEVNSPSSTGWQDIITGLTYIDNLIKIYGYMIRDTYIDFIPYGESGYEVIPEYIKNENKLKIKIGNSSRCNKPCKLILEYTKTTD